MSSYISVDFSGVTGTIDYAGIEPGTPLTVGAGYQVNVTVPSGTTSGMNYLGIGGLGSYNDEVLICVTSCAGCREPSPAAGERYINPNLSGC